MNEQELLDEVDRRIARAIDNSAEAIAKLVEERLTNVIRAARINPAERFTGIACDWDYANWPKPVPLNAIELPATPARVPGPE